MTLEAGTQIGRYVIRRKLAEGGMAEIYLATARGPEGFEKEVVIKRVRAFLASDPEFVGMFIAEARLASRLNHANVVQIFDFDKHEDTYYLAMEYVRGCSLWELRKRCKELMVPVPPMLVAHIGTEVARGLHYAHRLKVNGQPLDLVHRDVTPHNVLLSYEGAVKLTDFGIAKAGNRLTQPGVLKGKYSYMSPEQARGEPVDARTDVFALGVVLWELLTGGRLFDGDSEVAVLRAVQQSAIPPPARLNPDVPADLDAAVVRALEREPAARFQTAGELERALAQCVLKHATSVDDTDLPAFLRRLFPSATQHSLPVVQGHERTHVVEGVPVPGAPEAAGPAPEPAAREPTAVMAGVSRSRGERSPDEDVSAATFVLPREGDARAAPSRPPPAPTPMMPLPAVFVAPGARAGGSQAGASPGGTEAPGPGEHGTAGAGQGSTPGPATVSMRGVKQEDPASRRPQAPAGTEGSAAGPELQPGSAVPGPGERPEPGGSRPAPRRRPLALGLSLALGLAVVAGAVAVMRSPPVPAASSPEAAAPAVPREAAPAESPVSPTAAPGNPDAEAELEGLQREELLAPGPASAAPAVPAAAEAKERAPAAVSTGTLQVFAAPYATVFLNGKRLDDVVGRASYKLAPGTYRLLFQHPAGEKRFDVTVTAGATVTREFRAPRGR